MIARRNPLYIRNVLLVSAAFALTLPAQLTGVSPVTLSPNQLTFNSTVDAPASPQNLLVLSPNDTATSFTASAYPSSWLMVTPTSGTTPSVVSVSVTPGSLAAGAYPGFVSITENNQTTVVPVTLNVSATGNSGFSATPGTLIFNFQSGSIVPQTQQVAVAASDLRNTGFSATTVTNNGGTWLNIGPASGTTPTSLSVNVNPAGLATGVYFGALAINAPGTTGLVVPVEVNIGGPTTLNVSAQQLNFAYQIGTTTPAAQNLNVTSVSGGQISFTAAASSASCGNNWLVVSPQSSATPSTLSVQINTTSLPLTTETCPGTITISAPGASNPTITIPVTLLASTSPLLLVPTTGPTFTYQIGAGAPASQSVQITSSSTALAFTATATPVSGGPDFLNITPSSGTTPQSLTLSVNQTVLAGLAPNTYAENVTLGSPAAGNPSQTFTVTLVVSSNPTLVTSQQSVTFNYEVGQSAPASQTLTLTSTGAPLTYTVSTTSTSCNGFLSATPTSGLTSFTAGQQTQLVLSVNTAGLTTQQTCNGTVSISTGSNGPPITIPVTLNVSTTPLITLSPGALNVFAVTGTTSTVTQPVSIVSTDPAATLNFTATATTNPAGLTWLSVTPQTGATPASLQVMVTASGLPPGVYTGAISVTSSTSNVPSQTIPVTLTVTAGPVAVSPTTLSFTQAVGAAAPASQVIQVGSLPTGATIGAAVSTLNSSGWLTATISGNAVTVTANGSNLAAGTYSGVITIIVPGAGNSPFYVPVTLTVGGTPLFGVTPSSVSFTYQQNAALPPPQTLQLTSTSGTVPFNAVAVAGTGTSNVIFITLTPASGTTPGNLSVSLNQAVVSTLGPGTYTNTIQLSSSPLGNTQPITVTLTVTAAGPPTVTAIVSAADFLAGSVSPGEIVTIFGSNIGPSTPLGLTLSSTGTVETTLGTTTVTFNGVAAPLTYVSANQINAIVPYEASGLTSANVVVMNNGTTSTSFQVNIAPTAPAIFATSQNGSGQGAILNQDLTVNSSTNPAAQGTAIAIYATGEGQLMPAGVTGSVTTSTGPDFPKPMNAVTVSIGGQPATVLYAGEAPGLVSGVLQVNAIVPSNIGTGNQQVVITIGGVSSPNVITAAIK